MEKIYHKNVLEDLKEFNKFMGIKKNEFDWKKSNESAAKEWNKKKPKDETGFTRFYEESKDYIESMATYNAMGKKLRLIEKISKIIKDIPDIKTIVDYGCGVGSDSLHLDKLGYKVIAMDVQGISLTFAKSRFKKYGAKIKTVESNYKSKIPKCDLILSLDTLEHVFDPYKTLDTMFAAQPKAILLTTAFGVHDHENQGGIPMHTDHKVHKVEKYIEENGYSKKKLNMPFPPRLFIKNK